MAKGRVRVLDWRYYSGANITRVWFAIDGLHACKDIPGEWNDKAELEKKIKELEGN